MKKRLGLLILCLFVVFFCCGCSSVAEPIPVEATLKPAPEPVYEYEEVYLRLTEPCGTGFVLQENVCQAAVGSRTYQFVSSIPIEDRAAFIDGQERLCGLLEEHGISAAEKRFLVLPDYTNWTDSEKDVAYYGLDGLNSWQQALTTLQLALGDYANYGYLYALADRLTAELGWQRDEAAEAGPLPDAALLNLVYPCFDEFYTPAEEVAACKALSKELLAGLDDVWSEEAFLQARDAWAEAQYPDFQSTTLDFAYASESCPLKLRTRYTEIFRTPAFTQDAYAANGLFEEDYLSSLDGMIRGLGWLDGYLTTLRETFGVDDPALIPVVLRDEVGKYAEMTYSGYFHAAADGGHITSNSLHTLVHEYVHYLYWLRGGTSDPAYESWINEVAACTFALPVEYEAFYRSYLLAEPEIRAKWTEKLGKDFEGPEDYIRYLRIVCRTEELPHPYKYYLISEYALRPVFGEYFVRTYGEDVFLDWVLAPSRSKALTGKTVDEIVDDWCADMDMPEND
ncbi:MAG: hypothetical protein IJL51_02890 [Oscillospiraceae bacterium]|nr:hypothetical protein [Oscillospiraceae bacterium]